MQRPRLSTDELHALRSRRDRARNMAFLGFGLAFFGGLVLNYSVLAAVALLAAGLALFALGTILWALRALRLHRLADPWAYDPDLDGPDRHKRHELDDSYDEAPEAPPERGP